MNILHLLSTARLEGTGVARIVGHLAEGLETEQHRTHAWFLHEDGPLAADLQEKGIEVRFLRFRRRGPDLGGLWRFWRALRTNQFEIVHEHYGGRTIRALVHIFSKAKVIVHSHGRTAENLEPIPLKLWGADLAIAVSNAVAGTISGVPVRVVYPGISVTEGGSIIDGVAFDQGNERIIGTACRLAPIKALNLLIEAMDVLHAEIPGLRMEIAGTGPERDVLEQLIVSRGLSDCVHFLGWQRDLRPVMKRWTAFVICSLDEGMPLSVLEAMALGLPVVATAVGGIPELLGDAKTGLLVPPGDSLALANALRTVLLNPTQQQILGVAAQRRVRDCFSKERMVKQISMIYRDLLQDGSRDSLSQK
jgi:glycosyltransferase involved in cell wall biosynthesis